MKELAQNIQIVINTLETLNMPATFNNVNHMTGIHKLLAQVRDTLMSIPEITAGTEEKPEEADKDVHCE